MTTEKSLEQIQADLSEWARNEAAVRDRNLLLENRIAELTMEIRDAILQTQNSFELSRNADLTMRLVVEEAVLAMQARGTEQLRTIATQKDQIDNLEAKVAGTEAEVRQAIDVMVAELELPPNRHRSLLNAVHDACTLVVEAKKIIQENL